MRSKGVVAVVVGRWRLSEEPTAKIDKPKE
jgi:hypothetical protein